MPRSKCSECNLDFIYPEIVGLDTFGLEYVPTVCLPCASKPENNPSSIMRPEGEDTKEVVSLINKFIRR